MKFIRIEHNPIGKIATVLTRIEIDTKPITHSSTTISTETEFNNEEATKVLWKLLDGHEFTEEDVVIQPQSIGREQNGYDIYFRINYLPILIGWSSTIAQAIMIKDWMVKSK